MEEAEKARDKVQMNYTAQRQTRSASKPLELGQKVWLQDQQTKRWTIGGTVKSIRNGGRSYVVETDSGAAYLRNRRFIKAATARVTVVALRVENHRTTIKKTNKKRVSSDTMKKVSFKLGVRFQ